MFSVGLLIKFNLAKIIFLTNKTFLAYILCLISKQYYHNIGVENMYTSIDTSYDCDIFREMLEFKITIKCAKIFRVACNSTQIIVILSYI